MTDEASDLRAIIHQRDEEIAELRRWLGIVLDCVDYTANACTPTEMVGGVLPREVIEEARAVCKKG